MNTQHQLFSCIIERCETESEWHEARKTGIGASEAAAVLGVGYANQSPLTVWASKTGGPAVEFDSEQLRRLNRGKKLEPVIASEFEIETGLTCIDPGDYTIFRSTKFLWLFATLDRYTIHDEFGPVPVELKAVSSRNRNEWDDEEPPLKFQVQCQVQMLVTGATHCYLVGLIGGDEIAVRLIERNQRFIDAMVSKLREFWGYVEWKEMPPVDESEATARMLSAIYPRDNSTTVDLPPAAIDWDADLTRIKDEIKNLEAKKTALENQIKAAIGDATFGTFPNGKFSWKSQTTRRIDTEAIKERFPEVASECEKVSEFRVLRRLK